MTKMVKPSRDFSVHLDFHSEEEIEKREARTTDLWTGIECLKTQHCQFPN